MKDIILVSQGLDYFVGKSNKYNNIAVFRKSEAYPSHWVFVILEMLYSM